MEFTGQGAATDYPLVAEEITRLSGLPEVRAAFGIAVLHAQPDLFVALDHLESDRADLHDRRAFGIGVGDESDGSRDRFSADRHPRARFRLQAPGIRAGFTVRQV